MAGLVAMVAALIVVALEMYLATRGAGHAHSQHYHFWDEGEGEEEGGGEGNGQPGAAYKDAPSTNGQYLSAPRPSDFELEPMDASRQGLIAGASPRPSNGSRFTGSHASDGRDESGEPDGVKSGDRNEDDSDLDLEPHELGAVPVKPRHVRQYPDGEPSSVPPTPRVITPEEQARLLRQCLMLEGGILFHSVFIGMAISVATGPTFVAFLIAISFHQTFEGLALGSRIAAIQLPRRSARPWLMVLAFGATTPFGQLIGLIMHKMYDPMSQAGLLMVGFMNSISSGLLLFAGLVQLLAEDFLTEKSYSTLVGRRRWRAYMAVISGAMLMAIVGGFA